MSGDVHAGFCESRGVRLPPATHLVVLVHGTRDHAEALRQEVAAILRPMGLRLSDTKTRIAHIDEGMDFLGFRVQRQPKRWSGKPTVYTFPDQGAPRFGQVEGAGGDHRATNQSLAVLFYRLRSDSAALDQLLPAWDLDGDLRLPPALHLAPGGVLVTASTPMPTGSGSGGATSPGGGRRIVR